MGKFDGQHSVMPRSLAEELMRAGVKHFASGGQFGGSTALSTGGNPYGTTASDVQNGNYGSAIESGSNPVEAINGIGQGVQGLGQMFTAQNNFQAAAPGITTQNLGAPLAISQDQSQAVYNNQANLAQQLMAQSQGQGPNPAQQQLAQSTGQNIAAQGALMAGQRGASSNPALIARQAAEQGAATQQQSVGQAATLGAQQQLGAESSLAGVYGQQGNEANQQQSILQGAQAAQNSAITTGQLGSQQINANTSAQNTAAQNSTTGGILSALGGGGASLFNKGGKVQKLADGGIAGYETPTNPNIQMKDYGPTPAQSDASNKNAAKMGQSAGNYLQNLDDGGDVEPLMGIDNFSSPTAAPSTSSAQPSSSGGGAWAQPSKGGGSGLAGGLMALLSKGGDIPFSNKLLKGGDVPGKASVKGDSPKNDNQPTLLSPGEEVLPRSITMAKDAPAKAAAFVAHLQKNKKGKGGYGDVIGAKKNLEDRVKHLEKLCSGGYA